MTSQGVTEQIYIQGLELLLSVRWPHVDDKIKHYLLFNLQFILEDGAEYI